MNRYALSVIAIAAAFAAVPALAAELEIQGVGIKRDIPCNGNDISVLGAENVIKLTGQCGKIDVHGSNHSVTFERGTELSVSGADNKVFGGTVSHLVVEVAKHTIQATIKPTEGAGHVDVSGAEHHLALKLGGAVNLTVAGADQNVEWSLVDNAPEPNISSSGVKNNIQRKQ